MLTTPLWCTALLHTFRTSLPLLWVKQFDLDTAYELCWFSVRMLLYFILELGISLCDNRVETFKCTALLHVSIRLVVCVNSFGSSSMVATGRVARLTAGQSWLWLYYHRLLSEIEIGADRWQRGHGVSLDGKSNFVRWNDGLFGCKVFGLPEVRLLAVSYLSRLSSNSDERWLKWTGASSVVLGSEVRLPRAADKSCSSFMSSAVNCWNAVDESTNRQNEGSKDCCCLLCWVLSCPQ